jgi:cytidine deaminase
MTPEQLMFLAKEAMGQAYAPYSGFYVGAALLCADGTVYQGCNIENASYSPTNCAERTAFFHAIYDGHRDFTAIAICGGMGGKITNLCSPCGVCRQVMTEFCGPDFQIHLTDSTGAITTCTLAQLMPLSFSGAEHLL